MCLGFIICDTENRMTQHAEKRDGHGITGPNAVAQDLGVPATGNHSIIRLKQELGLQPR